MASHRPCCAHGKIYPTGVGLVLTVQSKAITMGMHRDSSNLDFDPIERDMRRQVWWTIYIFEKTLCSILGRPTAIDDREMSLHIPEAPMLEQIGVCPFLNQLGQCDSGLGHRGFSGEG